VQDLVGSSVGQGKYQLTSVIGRGGMATVYAAEHASLHRSVAVKVLNRHLSAQPDFVERFQREAAAIAQLEHPHVLPVYDTGQEGDVLYMVMLLAGEGTLKAHLQSDDPAPWSARRALGLARQILPALDVAHARGIVHRDIKPENILLHGERSYVADFGIAKLAHADPGLTMVGTFVGTPEYAAPEQVLGLDIDGRADLYSFGVVLYELLVGQAPYKGHTPIGVALQHVQTPLPSPTERNPALPAPLASVLVRALAKDREHRFASGAHFLVELEHAVDRSERPGFFSRPRVRAAVGLAGLVVAASVLLVHGATPDTQPVVAPARMGSPRSAFTATPLSSNRLLVVGGRRGGVGISSAEVFTQAANRWSGVTGLETPRSGHTSTRLADGRVLVVGGQQDESTFLDSALLYDPATNTWTSAGRLRTGRADHTATLLQGGNVLVVGGSRGGEVLDSAEVYSLATNTWTSVASAPSGRALHSATVLPSGQVLFVGGVGSERAADRYDPARDVWTPARPLSVARARHTATLLRDGKVLVAGGGAAPAEIYDPIADVWTPTRGPASTRIGHTATLLADGDVLVVGGSDGRDQLRSVERYDPGKSEWRSAADLTRPRWLHAAMLASNGDVLVVGGADGATVLAQVERYDPVRNAWAASTN